MTVGSQQTYLPDASQRAQVVDLVKVLESRGVDVPVQRAALVGADNRRVEIPDEVYDVLLHVARALAENRPVTVAPHSSLLTTQEAADFLGISRPTLVRLLEAGDMPFEMRGRHRRVLLSELLAYQQRLVAVRRTALDTMAQDLLDTDLLETTATPPPPTR